MKNEKILIDAKTKLKEAIILMWDYQNTLNTIEEKDAIKSFLSATTRHLIDESIIVVNQLYKLENNVQLNNPYPTPT